jgi:hypothetical protein
MNPPSHELIWTSLVLRRPLQGCCTPAEPGGRRLQFFEEIQKGLAVAVLNFGGSGAASLFLDQDLRLKE